MAIMRAIRIREKDPEKLPEEPQAEARPTDDALGLNSPPYARPFTYIGSHCAARGCQASASGVGEFPTLCVQHAARVDTPVYATTGDLPARFSMTTVRAEPEFQSTGSLTSSSPANPFTPNPFTLATPTQVWAELRRTSSDYGIPLSAVLGALVNALPAVGVVEANFEPRGTLRRCTSVIAPLGWIFCAGQRCSPGLEAVTGTMSLPNVANVIVKDSP